MSVKGKKTAPETVFAVMAVWSITDNYSETARKLKMAKTTVKDIVTANKDKEEFVILRTNIRGDFEKRATDIIDKGLELLTRRFTRALEHEDDIDELIDDVYDLDDKEASYKEKTVFVNKLRQLQLQDIRAISDTLSKLHDKRALEKGDATENVRFVDSDGELDKLAKIAGYVKKGK